MTLRLRDTFSLALIIALSVLFGMPASALAQDAEDIPPEEIAPEDVEGEVMKSEEDGRRPDGWHYQLGVGASFAINHTRKVVGATNGLTLALGGLLNGELDYVIGDHEWQSDLAVEQQQTKTPLLDGFIKSIDLLELKTLYLYRVNDWFGPFVRARLQTAILEGFDRRPEDTTVIRTARDGSVDIDIVDAQQKIDLTDPFEPFVIVETAGVFLEPITRKRFTLKTKAGFGGQHILVQDGYTITDDEDTPELELTQLEDSHSFGAELELEMFGKIQDNISWNILMNGFFPIVTNVEPEPDEIDKIHVAIDAGISVKLLSFLSLDYSLGIRRQPFVVDDWQVTNALLLTANYSFFE